MLQSSSIRSKFPDLMNEVRAFINGITHKSKQSSLELTKVSLLLLKHLPAARSAVLEYLCNVFDSAAQNFIVRLETEIATGKLPPINEYDEAILLEVHTILCLFISKNAEAWAPIISAWSLELLGEISTKYTGRAHISTGLNETLQLWMSCRSTRNLIDITTQCLSSLMHSDTESCINTLLDTSVKHSPNFDWVVAHVGSCFPTTVIVRVLSCGLKDFCKNKSYQQGCESPKLKSVVGILGHLAISHASDIQKALLELFQSSLQETSFQEADAVRIQRKATVPFLLHLLTLSPTLLNTISDDIKKTLPMNVILKLYNMTDDWCKYFGSPEALQQVLESLILKCDKGGSQIVELLLDCIFLNPQLCIDMAMANKIKSNSHELLESILQEIDFSIRHQIHNKETNVNILNSLTHDADLINSIFISSDILKAQIATRILIYIGRSNPTLLIKSLVFILENSKTDQHLALLVRILGNELLDRSIEIYCEKGGYFSKALEQILNKYKNFDQYESNNDLDLTQMWKNLLTLLRWEKSDKILLLKAKFISKALEVNLQTLTTLLNPHYLNSISLHILCEILDILDIPKINEAQPVEVILNFVKGGIEYFFFCCKETDNITRLKVFGRVKSILKRLCTHSKIARNLALRNFLERSLFATESDLFGAKHENLNNNQEVNKHLLTQNKKISKIINLTKHASIFNGGIIGTGKRKSICFRTLSTDFVASNSAQLIGVIKVCCSTTYSVPYGEASAINGDITFSSIKPQDDVLLDSVTLLSLMIVQLISPDVMYNGLPWPEEEFSKVTIERDLHIRRLFNNTPLLWDLLNFIALYRPALCYCSVLLRALTATVMHQWTSMGDQSKSSESENYKALMNTTVKVIDLIALGQLLPSPLSSIRDVVPFLNSFEIVAILRDCIWCYMRDHIPSPALFGLDANGLHWRDPTVARPPDLYTKTLRIIMQRNIQTVGHLYAQMFITVPTSME